jgi:hypothetical protein
LTKKKPPTRSFSQIKSGIFGKGRGQVRGEGARLNFPILLNSYKYESLPKVGKQYASLFMESPWAMK